MHSRLEAILAEKRKEVDRLKKRGLSTTRDNDIPPIRDFKAAISLLGRTGLIAEIKFASPSAGVIREKTDPLPIARIYEEAGAAAVSLLTDERFFGGELGQLPRLKRGISLPILRKDFIIDEVQVRESFLYGADAILLIARILSRQQLKELLIICRELGLTSLTEVHDRHDLEKAIDCGAEIIGVNNRNLDTFEVDLRTTLELAPLVPDKHIVVSESGIRNGEDIRLLNRDGVRAVLVGTSIMRSDDVAKKTRELVYAGNVGTAVKVKRW
jgi:indole-3-glycerol phosphate synthase